MSGEDSAYAVLGLKPGAKRAEVDEAYRRLIKQYHPDRTGGDGNRAAEINRAYMLLRRDVPKVAYPRRPPPVVIRRAPRRQPSRRLAWVLSGALLALVVIGFAEQGTIHGPSDRAYLVPQPLDLSDDGQQYSKAVAAVKSFDEPLQTGVIDQSIADAIRFHASGDSNASVEYSRDCHNKLRSQPTLAWFDACAAFDEATSALYDGTPDADSGPFNESEIIARQISSAQMISDDMMGADSRLHQIRSRVELELVPLLDKAAQQKL